MVCAEKMVWAAETHLETWERVLKWCNCRIKKTDQEAIAVVHVRENSGLNSIIDSSCGHEETQIDDRDVWELEPIRVNDGLDGGGERKGRIRTSPGILAKALEGLQ